MRFDVTEIAVVISARNHNPTLLNPDFLRYNEIVDATWVTSEDEPPITTPAVSRVTFSNGISVVVEPSTITFAERLDEDDTPHTPDIAKRYLTALPHVDYRAVGINPRGHVNFGSDPNLPNRFISERVMALSAEELGTPPFDADVQLHFHYGDAMLNLVLEDVALRDDPNQHVLLISGNYHHTASEADPAKRLAELHRYIDGWRDDISAFEKVALALVSGWKT